MRSLATVVLVLSVCMWGSLAEAGDKGKGKKKPDPRVTLELPVAGLRSDQDAELLRKVLKQKIGARGATDVVGRELILLKVEQGATVTLTDVRRVIDKAARKSRARPTLGDPLLRGDVELATGVKRPHKHVVAQLVGQLGKMKGVAPARRDTRSIKRLRLTIAAKQGVRLSSLRQVFAEVLRLPRRAEPFRDVIFHGPPGGGDDKKKGKESGKEEPKKSSSSGKKKSSDGPKTFTSFIK